MNVASMELCKELYELSGWKDTYWIFERYEGGRYFKATPREKISIGVPAYDLGYLLRKLPEGIELTNRNGWMVKYSDFIPSRNQVIHADTPEDAACKLAIELFKQGILTKETN